MEENNNKKEPKQVQIKLKLRTLIIIVIIIVVLLASNVFAGIMGYGNVFFMIRDLVAHQEVEGKENLLTDMDNEAEKEIEIELENKVVQSDLLVNNVENKSDEEKIEESYSLTVDEKKYIEEVIHKYYKLLSLQESDSLEVLAELELKVDMTQDPDYYKPENYFEHSDPYNYVWTGVKFKDFEKAMFTYSGEEFRKEKFPNYVEYEDYLFVEERLNPEADVYKVVSMNEAKSSEHECYYNVEVEHGSEIIKETVYLGRGNGDFCIIDVR